MTTVKHPVAVVFIFLWIGFVCAISFMEAWLKFQAPGITLALGLGIGRIVFDALNKVEWVLAIGIFTSIMLSGKDTLRTKNWLWLVIVLLLTIQTFWLLPELDTRAELHIQNRQIPTSNLHFYYVAIEAVKVIGLSIFGISLFKKPKYEQRTNH